MIDFQKTVIASMAISGTFLTNYQTNAQEEILQKIDQYSQNDLTQVEQLRDVYPGDWAYESLKNLVNRYNCIAGYPDGNYKGNHYLSRYEFAASVNNCLQTIENLIQQNQPIIQEDIRVLERLIEEFVVELTNLNNQLENLENRLALVENQKFSTNTKLRGEIAINLEAFAGQDKADNSGEEIEDNLVLNNRVRLNFDTSFTGKDLLKIRLDAINATPLGVPITGTNMTRLAFDLNTNNQVEIGRLFYSFPASKNLKFIIDATGGRFIANISNFNPLFSHPLTGSMSRFGRANPLYYQGILGAGVTANYQFSEVVQLSLGYLARDPQQSLESNGLFNGSYAAIAQLEITPTEEIDIGLTYVRAYYSENKGFVSGGTGSRLANRPFGDLSTSANHFGLQSSFRVSPTFTLSGWVGMSLAYAENNGNGFAGAKVSKNDQATIFNWAITLGIKDIGKKGSLSGLVIGNPPRTTNNDSGPENSDIPWHLESFYRYPITSNISISPGLLVILNPEGDSSNNAIFVGNLRTVFKF